MNPSVPRPASSGRVKFWSVSTAQSALPPCRVSWLYVAATASVFLAGCSEYEPPRFHLNRVAMQQAGRDGAITSLQQQEVANVLAALFGTPDEPHALPEAALDMKKLQMAAGPVRRDAEGLRTGLYREHCGHCHGISGDGMGPTAAFLNPYPRDYRPGLFKFKSTERAAKPTFDDLRKIVHDGIPGTAMPSFALLPPDELDAIVEYVKYLSIRGEVELRLIRTLVEEGELDTSREVLVGSEEEPGLLMQVADTWQEAPERIIVPADLPPDLDMDDPASVAASALKGKEIFYGQVAACVKCHGNAALGDGQATEPDDWSKGILPEDVAAGALPPRNIIPRNLRSGVYRGGRRPVDLYWRVWAGINGTPMPGLEAVAKAGTDIKPEDLWHLVNYVRSLPYEEGAALASQEPSIHRDRN